MFSQPSSLLRHRPFLAFWLAHVYTASGFQMPIVAVGRHIYELTGNVLDLGLVGLVEFLPRVLFMPHTGHIADRYDRRRIAALRQTGQALVTVALVFGAASGEIARNMIFVLAFALGTTRTFKMPTTQALLLNLVPAGLSPCVVAASASAAQAAAIVAPALGGLLYTFGASWVYVPTATFYVLACVLTFSLPVRNQPLTQDKATLDSLLAGIRFIRSRPDIFGAISFDLFTVLLDGTTALLPVFAKDILLTGSWGLGLLCSVPAVSTLAMSFWLAHFSIERNAGWIMFLSVGVFSLATIALGLSKSFWPSPGVLVVLGTTDMVSMVIRSAFVQLETPDKMRGRVDAVNGLFIGASNQLGEFESGLTAYWLDTVSTVVLGGIGTLVVTGAWMKLFPSLAQHDHLH